MSTKRGQVLLSYVVCLSVVFLTSGCSGVGPGQSLTPVATVSTAAPVSPPAAPAPTPAPSPTPTPLPAPAPPPAPAPVTSFDPGLGAEQRQVEPCSAAARASTTAHTVIGYEPTPGPDGNYYTAWSALLLDEGNGEICRKGDYKVPYDGMMVLKESDDEVVAVSFDEQTKLNTIHTYRVHSRTGEIEETAVTVLSGAGNYIRAMSPDRRFYYTVTRTMTGDYSGLYILHSFELTSSGLVERAAQQFGHYEYYLDRFPTRFYFTSDSRRVIIGDACGCSHWYGETLSVYDVDPVTGMPYGPQKIVDLSDSDRMSGDWSSPRGFRITPDNKFLYLLISVADGMELHARVFSLGDTVTEVAGSPAVVFSTNEADQWDTGQIGWIYREDQTFLVFNDRRSYVYQFQGANVVRVTELEESPAIEQRTSLRTLRVTPNGQAMVAGCAASDGSWGRDHWITYVRDAAGKYQRKYDYTFKQYLVKIIPRG